MLAEPRTLTKAELAELLFERVGLNKREAKDIVDTFFEEIRDALARGDSVKLSGFGNFQVRDKPPRPGRNPKTGETIPIAARRVVTFHASQKLKSVVEQATPAAVSYTHLFESSVTVWPFSSSSVSPSRAQRTDRSPWILSRSNTCEGRPSSSMT